MGVKYLLVLLLHRVGVYAAIASSTREAVNSVKLCHIGVADLKDKQE